MTRYQTPFVVVCLTVSLVYHLMTRYSNSFCSSMSDSVTSIPFNDQILNLLKLLCSSMSDSVTSIPFMYMCLTIII